MKKNLKGNILIFGGSGGLGYEVAKYFYNEGYNLLFTYNKSAPKVKEFKTENRSNKFFHTKCDFLKEKSIKNAIKLTRKKIGDIDYIINCVGIFYYDDITNFNYKKISETFKINVFSLLTINQCIFKLKRNKKISKIISIGSSSAVDGFKDTYSYCGSKHALLGIIKSLNQTIYKKKIFNYCLNVGSIKNKMGKKVRGNEFKNFIETNTVLKSLNFLVNLDLPALPDEIFIKRFRF